MQVLISHSQRSAKLRCFSNLNLIVKLANPSFSILKDLNSSQPKGKLSIVATPIGNLSDLTPNILKTLFKADLIGCQDRRVAGQLYNLIKNKNIIQRIQDKFGTIGISNLILKQQQEQKTTDQTQKQHQFYQYSNMGDKQRKKLLSKLTLQEQKEFKIEYLKYRAKKIINKSQQFLYKTKTDKFDQLYGIEVSDYKYIQTQIYNTRVKKGRGLLIPLNTYSETKMFDMVRNLLQSKHVAIVSDAGMPCISDPGWKIIRMIRQIMPSVPIQVIGGPSAIDVMLTLATITSKSNTLSGRFEGFASPQISSITEQNILYNKSLRQAKEKDFSIHFINSKKLKKNAYVLQRIYGEQHKIILANQLTKKYERKFNGNLKQLVDHISKDDKQFEGIGQMSYLLYSDHNKYNQIEQNIKKQKEQNKQIENSTVLALNIKTFVQSLKDTGLKAKQKAELVQTIFGIKHNQAKNIVYANTIKSPAKSLQ